MRRIQYGLAIIGMLGGLLVGTASTAGAGLGQSPRWYVSDSLNGYADVLEIELTNNGDTCNTSGTTVTFEDMSGTIGEATLSGDNSGTVIVPDDLVSTIFSIEVTCTILGTSVTRTAFEDEQGDEVFDADYAGLDVTKVVEGDAPEGTEFVIRVACEGSDADDVGPYDLAFDTDGGTNRVWFSDTHECELTETDDGGAESTTIVSEDCALGPQEVAGNGAESVVIVEPVRCDATVTNVFPTTPDTGPPTTPTTGGALTTTSQPSGGVSPAAAARPTRANPTFTG